MASEKYLRHGKKYYEANKQLCIERNRIQKAKWRKQWWEYKASLSCAHCGFAHPAALDFHHVEPHTKEENVNKLAANGLYARAFKEIEKCIPLCANCHRIHHYNEQQAQKKSPEEEPGISVSNTESSARRLALDTEPQ